MQRATFSLFMRRVCIVATLTSGPAIGQAALITGTTNASPSVPSNLTLLGTTDWAFWTADSTAVSSMVPKNRKSGGTTSITNATPIGGTQVRGSTTMTGQSFTYANGTSPASQSGVTVSGVFNDTLNSANSGVQTTLTLPDTQLYKVLVWVSGYNATGKFTASLPAGTTFQNSAFTYSGTKVARLYELQVKADTPSQSLTLAYQVGTVQSGGSTHVLLNGVALSPVPEPVSLSMLGAAGAVLMRRRSRR